VNFMAKTNKDSQKEPNLRVQGQRIKGLSSDDFFLLRQMCAFSNNLYNVALYSVRQHYFATGKYLRYEGNYHKCKGNENYRLLQAGVAQQSLKDVGEAMLSFFAELKLKKAGQYDEKVRMPHYQQKGGLYTLTLSTNAIAIHDGKLLLPMSHTFTKLFGSHKIYIPVPKNLLGEDICEVRIKPVCGGRWFKADFVYKIEQSPQQAEKDSALSVDIGTENLATCIATTGASFIMDGRKAKSINQRWNKRKAHLQAIGDKQAHGKRHGIGRKEAALTDRRNRRTKDILNKTAKYIVNYCLANRIGTIIVGSNKNQKKGICLGKVNNQNFVQLPFSRLRKQLESLCWKYGIRYIEQEESYTSKASFADGDSIPVHKASGKQKYAFSGRRIKRGLYRCADGRLVNADVNGAANILRKSGVAFDRESVLRGLFANPQRIRIA